MLPLVGLVAASAVMAAAWRRQRRTGNAGLVDVLWAAGIGALAVAAALLADGWAPRRVLVGTLGALWAGRLTLHLYRRVTTEPEDGRYSELRDELGGARGRVAVLVLPGPGAARRPALASLPLPGERGAPGLAAGSTHWAWPSSPSPGSGRTSPTDSWRAGARTRRTAARPVARASGATRATPTTSSSGSTGWSTRSSGSASPWGWALWFAPALMLFLVLRVTGIPPTERAVGEAAAARTTARTSAPPTPSSPVRPESSSGPTPSRALPDRPHEDRPATRREGLRAQASAPPRHPPPAARAPARAATAVYDADRDGALRCWLESACARRRSRRSPRRPTSSTTRCPRSSSGSCSATGSSTAVAYYADEHTTLDEAEEAMLALTAERAGLCADGQDVLELGCGWGSLTLWMAEHFPASRILAVSRTPARSASRSSPTHGRGLGNVEVVTCDMNEFDDGPALRPRGLGRDVRAHAQLGGAALPRRRLAAADGRLFLHVFAHRATPIRSRCVDDSDWMSRYFFTGGMMPSHDLLDHLESPFEVEERWAVPGTHYARTVRGLAAQHRAPARRGDAGLADDLRRGRRRAVVPPLARLLPGLRRAVRLRPTATSGSSPTTACASPAHDHQEPTRTPAPATRVRQPRALARRVGGRRTRPERRPALDRLGPRRALHRAAPGVSPGSRRRLELGGRDLRRWASTACACSRSRPSTTATSRTGPSRPRDPIQLAFALLGATAVQRGPLWWAAAHHRAHHRDSDREGDVHSPDRDGFWWSHVGWILARRTSARGRSSCAT